jgi:hypothetical protein
MTPTANALFGTLADGLPARPAGIGTQATSPSFSASSRVAGAILALVITTNLHVGSVHLQQQPPPPDRARASIPWLSEVVDLCNSGRTDDAAYRVADAIDRMLSAGQLAECDGVLRAIDVASIHTDVLVTFLMVTVAARDSLPSRPALLKKVEQLLLPIDGPEEVSRLMAMLT